MVAYDIENENGNNKKQFNYKKANYQELKRYFIEICRLEERLKDQGINEQYEKFCMF